MKLLILVSLSIFFSLSTPISAAVLNQNTNSIPVLSIPKEGMSKNPVIQQFKTALKIAKEELNSKKNIRKTSRILIILGLILLVIGLVGSLPYLNLAGNQVFTARERQNSLIYGIMFYLGIILSIVSLILLVIDAINKKQSIKSSFKELRDLIKYKESKPA
jgi:uncharacterized membrane protein YidH (DUF202 family)